MMPDTVDPNGIARDEQFYRKQTKDGFEILSTFDEF